MLCAQALQFVDNTCPVRCTRRWVTLVGNRPVFAGQCADASTGITDFLGAIQHCKWRRPCWSGGRRTGGSRRLGRSPGERLWSGCVGRSGRTSARIASRAIGPDGGSGFAAKELIPEVIDGVKNVILACVLGATVHKCCSSKCRNCARLWAAAVERPCWRTKCFVLGHHSSYLSRCKLSIPLTAL